MFFDVKIGITTRKGHFVPNVQYVVAFMGNQNLLYGMIQKRYIGFDVHISEITEVVTIENSPPPNDTTPGELTKCTSQYSTERELKALIPVALSDAQSKERKKALIDLQGVESRIEDEIRKKLNEHPFVKYVRVESFDEQKAMVKVYTTGDIWVNTSEKAKDLD